MLLHNALSGNRCASFDYKRFRFWGNNCATKKLELPQVSFYSQQYRNMQNARASEMKGERLVRLGNQN